MKGLMLHQNPESAADWICGAQLVWIGCSPEDPEIGDFEALVECCRLRKPDLIVGGDSESEKLLLSRLSARLSIPIFTNCLKMEIDDRIRLFRADGTGERLDVFSCMPPCILSFAEIPGAQNAQENLSDTSDGLLIPALSKDAIRRLVTDPRVETLSVEAAAEKISEEILVCVGRGAGAAGTRLAETFARQIGAQVGCTRAVVEDGLMDRSFQIGQSGKSVSPRLYLGFGVSGAFQHQVGMRQAGRIIAVNVNPHAPLFSVSDMGLIADARAVLRILTDLTENAEKSQR